MPYPMPPSPTRTSSIPEVYKELSSYERCVVDVGADSGESDECIW